MVARGDVDFATRSREPSSPTWTGRADHGVGRRSFRLLRAVRARAHPHDQRSEGQEDRHPEPELGRALLPRDHGRARRARPQARLRVGHQLPTDAHGAVCRGQSRCVSRVPARATGAARPQDRSRDHQHDQDKPWSQYFCCMLYGSREFVRDYPIATKRYLRAVLKAAEICADEPEKAAQRLVDAGFAATTTRSRRSSRSSTASGGITTPRTPCASTRCSCTRRA